MDKRWISCNVCGADDYQALSSVKEWNIGKCTRCGLIYLNPAPFFAPTSEFSEMSKGFQYTRYMHEKITPKIMAHENHQFSSQLREISQLTGQTFPTMRYLEVGCGSGASVQAATDLGWEATGIDIDPELIGAGRSQMKADLRCVPLLESRLKENSFHFIRLRDVIEHLPDPYESLLEIKRLLRPGGIALFVTPNEGGLVNRVRLSFGGKREMIAWGEPPHHIHGFTPVTLQRILQRAGFKILSMKTTTPVDPGYVTSNNMRSVSRRDLTCVWECSRMLGMGNFLVGWAQKA